MYTTINYNPQRKVLGDKYFLQYPNWNNIAALWKMFGCVRIEELEGKVRNFEFRLFDSTETSEDKLNFAIMQLPLLFPKYDTKFIGGTPKKVIITPKEETNYLDNIDWLTDKRTKRIVSNEEYIKIRSSIWFIS